MWPIVAIALAVFGAVAWLVFSERSGREAASNELRKEISELRSQLASSDVTLSALQAETQQLRRGALAAGGSQATVGSLPETELNRRFAELTRLQSNTAILVQGLVTRTTDASSPVPDALRRQAAIVALEASVQEHGQRVEAAKQRATDLLLSLNIPAEVSTMDAAKALDTASLRAYWPYFEAKRERDTLQNLAERIQSRLLAERVDAAIAARSEGLAR